MLYAEVMEGKDRMDKKKFTDRFQSTVASSLRLGEGCQYCGQFEEERQQAKNENRKEYFNGDSWFASVPVAEQFALQGHEFMGPVRIKEYLLLIYHRTIHVTQCFLILTIHRSKLTTSSYHLRILNPR